MLILKVFTMGRRKEIDLDKMKVLYNQGLSDYEIAKKLNCSRKTIFRRREELGLPVNYWQSPIWNQVEEVKNMLEACDKDAVHYNAPACGLYLVQISYEVF